MFMCTRDISFSVSMILLKCLYKARNVSGHVMCTRDISLSVFL